jgi:putative intracellular protease/amidase
VSELYNARELFGTIKVLKENGIAIDVVSGQIYIQDENSPKQLRLKMTYETLDTQDITNRYDGVICVSGALKPTMAQWKNKVIQDIVQQMNAAGKVCAGICCAAPSVGPAMKGKRVATYDTIRAKDWCEINGAILTGKTMEIDGNVITAANEQKTEDWAEAIVQFLIKGE